VRLANASTAWHGARSIVDGKCQELKQAIRAHYGNSHPDVLKAIEGNMHKIDAVVGKLDHRLTESLQKASKAADAARAAEVTAGSAARTADLGATAGSPATGLLDRD